MVAALQVNSEMQSLGMFSSLNNRKRDQKGCQSSSPHSCGRDFPAVDQSEWSETWWDVT